MAADFNLSFDATRVYREIVNAIEDELSKIGDRFVDIAKREALKVTYVGRTGKGAPGDPAWRDEVSQGIKKFPFRVEGGQIILPVGLDLPEANGWGSAASTIRALVVTYGSGDKAQTDGGLGAMIHARPGETVWNDSLTGTTESTAESTFILPSEFNHEGNMWLENTMRQIQPELNDLQKRVPDIVADIVRRNIR